MPEMTYADAIREGIREEMLRDERVILLGEEIGVFGGAYKVTRGLLDEFGPSRVRDTPISEIAIAGMAIGAALGGLRPVAEIMYMDFLPICLDQLATQAAKIRFMSGGELSVPMVLRTQYSLGRQHGAQHSQFFPSVFLQVPGLKVALPSTPADAKGLFKSAVRDGNPVLFIEGGVLYRRKGLVPEGDYTTPFGVADVKRKGDDATIVAFSRMVGEALTAADMLEKDGISVEVVDPRTVQPLDTDTIVESLKRTGRLVVASDDVKSGGLGAEVCARAMENAFDYLDAPIQRVSSPDLPVPFSPELERQYMPNSSKVVEAVKSIV